MLGYKFINIKIQVALIKQIMYSYLFNLFISSPNIFFKLILTNFSKDTLNANSKEQYEKFVQNNQNIFSEFFKSLPLKYRKYMFLSVILNKDMKTNFNSLNDDEIFNLGTEELKNIFFDVFFDLLEKIKKEFNINLDKLLEDEKQKAESKESFEQVFKTSKLIQTKQDIKKPILIQSLNPETVNLSESGKTGIQTNIIKNKLGLLEDDALLRKLFDGSYGLHGEFYYKIKDRLDVRLNCGSTTRENIIIFSNRNIINSKDNREILGVQQFFNWKNDNTYKNFDQFIFIRNLGIKENINFNDSNSYTYKNSFDEQKYLGAKILNKKEIEELGQKLQSSGDSSGFLAIIPLQTIKEEDVIHINNFLQNLSNTKSIYLSGFSQEERQLKLSAIDVLKILGLKKEGPLSRTIAYQQDPYVSFDINELFDVYFSTLNITYYLNEIQKTLFSAQEILKSQSSMSTTIPEKEGKFLLEFKLLEDIQSKQSTIKYFTLKRTKILDIKLSTSNEQKFQDIGFKSYLSDTDLDDANAVYIINSVTSQFLRTKYYNKFLNILEKDEYNLVKDSLFPSDIYTNSVIEKLNFGTFNYSIPNELKSLRSYKNYSDFLKYYIDIVEALAKESADRV